jgi:hypothetical protein
MIQVVFSIFSKYSAHQILKTINMKKALVPILFTGFILTLGACSSRLTGTWQIQRYETLTPGSNTPGSVAENIGTIQFRANGRGEKNISYQLMGSLIEDRLPFRWVKERNFVNIDSRGSALSKSWIQIENRRRYQRWKSTDGNDEVQILELMK